VNGYTRGDQFGLTGHQRDGRIDAGSQVHGRGPWRRVCGEIWANTLVEDFERDGCPGKR